MRLARPAALMVALASVWASAASASGNLALSGDSETASHVQRPDAAAEGAENALSAQVNDASLHAGAEPASVLLLGTGLLGLAAAVR